MGVDSSQQMMWLARDPPAPKESGSTSIEVAELASDRLAAETLLELALDLKKKGISQLARDYKLGPRTKGPFASYGITFPATVHRQQHFVCPAVRVIILIRLRAHFDVFQSVSTNM